MSKTLVELCKSYGGKLPEKQRAYRVKMPDSTFRFVFSNSPGQAALSVCEVERVTDKELVTAAFEALTAK